MHWSIEATNGSHECIPGRTSPIFFLQLPEAYYVVLIAPAIPQKTTELNRFLHQMQVVVPMILYIYSFEKKTTIARQVVTLGAGSGGGLVYKLFCQVSQISLSTTAAGLLTIAAKNSRSATACTFMRYEIVLTRQKTVTHKSPIIVTRNP